MSETMVSPNFTRLQYNSRLTYDSDDDLTHDDGVLSSNFTERATASPPTTKNT